MDPVFSFFPFLPSTLTVSPGSNFSAVLWTLHSGSTLEKWGLENLPWHATGQVWGSATATIILVQLPFLISRCGCECFFPLSFSHFPCSSLLSALFFVFSYPSYLLDIISHGTTSSFSRPALGTMEEDELVYILGLTDHLENHGFFLSCPPSLVPIMRIWVSVWRREIDRQERGRLHFLS